MHLDDDRIQRLIHDELIGPAEMSARAHIAECVECRRRLRDVEREEAAVNGLLRELDHPTPVVGARVIVGRAREHPAGLLRWAAGLAAALAVAGAAYAMPGSPFKAWVGALVQRIAERRARPSATHAVEPPRPPAVGGIAVVPGANLVVAFTSTQDEGRVRVSLGDGREVVIRGPSGAATYTSESERLVVDNRASSASFEIEVPRGAPRFELLVASHRIFLKEGARVTASSSPERSDSSYLLPLSPTGS